MSDFIKVSRCWALAFVTKEGFVDGNIIYIYVFWFQGILYIDDYSGIFLEIRLKTYGIYCSADFVSGILYRQSNGIVRNHHL